MTATPSTTGGDYSNPLDSVPNSKGTTFYFTAKSAAGVPGVYSVAASGGTAKVIASGAPFVSPLGIAISSDDSTLYVADPGAEVDPNNDGAVFTVPVSGGAAAALAGTAGYEPRGMDVRKTSSGDVLYFAGVDPSDMVAGLFQMATAGGTPMALAKGAPISDPSGVAVTATGDVYLADAGTAAGRLILVHAGSASVVAGNLRVGYPAGVALTLDGKTAFVSGLDPVAETSLVYAVNLTSGHVTTQAASIGVNNESGGLHRASASGVMSWCGVTAGAGEGLVYRVLVQ
jgi:DNA-binding beta-propeller fold protein YncE